MKILFTLFSCLLLILGSTSCNRHNGYDKEAAALLLQSHELNQEHAHINVQIKNLWDSTSSILACELPADLPPIDRNVFLDSRSAYHIRMFMSYKQLNGRIHSIVDAAAKQDENFSNQLHILAKQKQEFENQKNKFLRTVSEHDVNLYHHYAEKFQMKSDDTHPARSITKIN